MNVRELMHELQKFNPDHEIAILDGFNAGGSPRTINFGPIEQFVKIDLDCDDIDTPPGGTIVLMGYGCY